MQVQVPHGLATVLATINDETVPGFGKATLSGDHGSADHELADQAGMGVVHLRQAADMKAGDNQDMGRGCGRYVTEGKKLVIAEDLFAWYFPGNNITE